MNFKNKKFNYEYLKYVLEQYYKTDMVKKVMIGTYKPAYEKC